MHWEKKNKIFCAEGQHSWMVSHAQVPTVEQLTSDDLRVYFGTRDRYQRTVTTYLDINITPSFEITAINDKPALGLGEIGTFDDCGAMPSWIVNYHGQKRLYYTGWNTGKTIPYRTAIGLAVSEDGGRSFNRMYTGPILDRGPSEPYFCSQPCVLIDQECWRMWYISCVSWNIINGRPEPRYNIKYAESSNGTHWKPQQITCIDFKSSDEGGIARPCVIKNDDGYAMWYSYRKLADYRTNQNNSYRIGYAVSADGVNWQRQDDIAGIDVSPQGWDSMMIAYPFVLLHGDRKYMFYNGNGFGQSGFGYAVQNQENENSH